MLTVNDARYAQIMEETSQVVFEWDILQNHICHTEHWNRKFGCSALTENPCSDIPSFEPVHPGDRDKMELLFRRILAGEQPGPLDVRMKAIHGRYIRCTVYIRNLKDGNGRPYRAVGLITDSVFGGKPPRKSESRPDVDSLTQFYSRTAAESMIEDCLKHSLNRLHGMILVDLDNFKNINDTLGHIFGDAVLKKASSDIRQLFSRSDIVGRTGGDEFVIFVKEMDSAGQLEDKMRDVCGIFHCAGEGEDEIYQLSASMGGAVCPDAGTTFGELYRHAGEALHSAKKSGKNRYMLYS